MELSNKKISINNILYISLTKIIIVVFEQYLFIICLRVNLFIIINLSFI